MASIDWRLLDNGGFDFGNALAHYEAGQERRAGIEKQNALVNYAASPSEETLAPLIARDPELGMKMRSDMRAEQERTRRKDIIRQYKDDPSGARNAALGDGDAEALKIVDGLDDRQREFAKQMNEGFARYLFPLLKTPYEQRKAKIAQDTPTLLEAGFTEQQIAGYDPTDENINRSLFQAMSLKDILEQSKPPSAPSGFRWKADGSAVEPLPGYVEGVGQIAGTRREAVTSRPMPRVAKAGGGKKASAGGGKPWERDY